ALVIDRRQFVSGSKHDDETTVRYSKRAGCQDQTAIAGACEGDDAALDLTGVAHVDWSDVHLERRSHRLDDAELADPGGHCGIANTTARITPGAICLSSSSHLPPMPYSNDVNPVALPPGRARLFTNPAPTGSAATGKTIGTVRVICSSGPTV